MLNAVPLLGREFHIDRGNGFIMVYPFRCRVSIYEPIPEAEGKKNLKRLNEYFSMLMRYGTPNPSGKGSVSQQKKIMIEKECVESDLTGLASAAMYHGLGKKQHTRVQDHLHSSCPFTIASEIPVWSVIEDFKDGLGGESLLHGHIDLIRYMPNGRVQVLDFKPGASKETKAASQVWRYMWLLSLRTGISMGDIDGFYFDDEVCYKIISQVT